MIKIHFKSLWYSSMLKVISLCFIKVINKIIKIFYAHFFLLESHSKSWGHRLLKVSGLYYIKKKEIFVDLNEKKAWVWVFVLLCIVRMHAQSCPTLCSPMNCSPPGSSVHGISQARYWRRLAFPPLGDLPDPGTELHPLHWQVDSLSLSHLVISFGTNLPLQKRSSTIWVFEQFSISLLWEVHRDMRCQILQSKDEDIQDLGVLLVYVVYFPIWALNIMVKIAHLIFGILGLEENIKVIWFTQTLFHILLEKQSKTLNHLCSVLVCINFANLREDLLACVLVSVP